MPMKLILRRGGIAARLLVAMGIGTLVWRLALHPPLSSKLGRAPFVSERPPSGNSFYPLNSASLPSSSEQVEIRPTYLPSALAEVTRIDSRGSTPEDRRLVWNYLNQVGVDPSEKEADWLMGADEAMSWLRGAVDASSELESELVQLVLNPQRPLTLREYAIQHLGSWAEERQAGAGVLEAFKALAGASPASRLSAVALAALFRSQFAQQQKEWLSRTAYELVANTDADSFVRCTALDVLGGIGHPAAEPLARQILRQSDTASGRACALQTLGRVGDASTYEWLEAQAEETEPIAAAARKQALQNMRRSDAFR